MDLLKRLHLRRRRSRFPSSRTPSQPLPVSYYHHHPRSSLTLSCFGFSLSLPSCLSDNQPRSLVLLLPPPPSSPSSRLPTPPLVVPTFFTFPLFWFPSRYPIAQSVQSKQRILKQVQSPVGSETLRSKSEHGLVSARSIARFVSLCSSNVLVLLFVEGSSRFQAVSSLFPVCALLQLPQLT